MLIHHGARAMASPWPVPWPTSLVVKKGSKTRWRTASGMPVPVSSTSDFDPGAVARVRTVMAPLRLGAGCGEASAIAWAALTIRLMITRLMSDGRQRHRRQVGIEVGRHARPRISIRCGRG